MLCVFENFAKKSFLSIMKDFRFFVKKHIGKILALFDVFLATLQGKIVTTQSLPVQGKKSKFPIQGKIVKTQSL